jgi:hypothetical protein
MVNQTRLLLLRAVSTQVFALEVQRAEFRDRLRRYEKR